MNNLWVWLGCHKIFQPICRHYNVRTLSSDDKLLDLEVEFSWINWTIIDLSDIWLQSKGCIILNNTDHTMYYSGGN